ncbi:MAG: recombination mediator RecR [Elusimicrobiota bacterium]
MVKVFDKLVQALQKLPGIGPRAAERLAYYVLRTNREEIVELANALVSSKRDIKKCSVCYNYTETDPCEICGDSNRDKTLLCVVEHPQDVSAIENIKSFNGLYHVLGGPISPLDGVTPDKLKLNELSTRVSNGSGIKEIILALDPDIEGEMTVNYIVAQLENINVKITRIAYGIPAGGDLEYADSVTLSQSIEGRKELRKK